MFDKAFQTAFVCLRCQSRLLRQQPQCSSSLRLRRPNVPAAARSQSTAVARVEEEEDHNEHPVQDERIFQKDEEPPKKVDDFGTTQDTNSFPPHMAEEISGGRRHDRTRYRKFRLERVDELGVSSLGKPAEVLVLEHRDRPIPTAPTEAEQDRGPQLMEALQAETVPLDPEQVRLNIEQVKKQFGNGGQVLDKPRWRELRNTLVKGFTHVQLLDYIHRMARQARRPPEQATGPNHKDSSRTLSFALSHLATEKPELKRSRRHNIKRMAAFSIMKDIWGFSLPAGEEEAEDMQSVTVSMARSHIGALKALKSQPFKKLSESLKVKIDIFQEKRQLVIHGSPDAIDQAKEAITSLKRQVMGTVIDLEQEKDLLPILREEGYAKRLVEEVGRNRAVYIDKTNLKKGPLLRVIHHQKSQQEAVAVRRDIHLAGRRLGPKSSVSIWPPLETRATWLVPYTSWQALPWWESVGSWGRWNFRKEKDAKDVKSSPTHGPPTSVLSKEIYQRLSESYLKPYSSLKFAASITRHHTALFGQSLFRRDVKQQLQSVLKAHQQPDLPPHNVGPRIVADIPLLAQSLASCTPWSVNSKGSAKSTPRPTLTGPFLHRLLLLPATAEPYLPALQVYLTGDNVQLGLRQPLRIHSISAILEECSHILILPDRHVDINFRRQTLYHIYCAPRKREPKHQYFNDQILRYLNHAQGKEVPEFAPSVKLSLPDQIADCFQNSGTLPPSTPTDIESPPEDAADTSPGAEETTSRAARKAGRTEYLLATSETVDVAAFSHDVTQGLCLNHVHSSAVDGTHSRQELRLAERPYPDTQATSVLFPRIFDRAYAVASWLGDPKFLKGAA